jgi:hypothetical protein
LHNSAFSYSSAAESSAKASQLYNEPQTSCYFEIDGSNDQFDGASSSPDPAESFWNVDEQ